MNEMLELGNLILISQPFSVFVGAEMTDFSEGAAEIRIPITENLKQQHGFVHGGVISYAADNSITFAGGSVLGPAVVTSEFKINYLKPAMGSVLIARSSVIYSGRNQAVCRCDVFVDNTENRCAVAQGTISKIGKKSDL